MKKCVACGGGHVRRDTRRRTFDYKGEVLSYDQPGHWCAECGEVFLEKSDKEATDPLIFNFQAKLDGRLTTDDIRRIRKKLCLTQKEAGEIIGGGPNAFSRYENGRSYPAKGVENFLRILDKHPEHIDELRQGEKIRHPPIATPSGAPGYSLEKPTATH